MKTIQTKSGEILLVKVPENAYDFELITDQSEVPYKTAIQYFTKCEVTGYPQGDSIIIGFNFKIIGKFSELKDEVFEEFVDKLDANIDTGYGLKQAYRDYHSIDLWYHTDIRASFQSLCKSQGIEDDLGNYLIVKKL